MQSILNTIKHKLNKERVLAALILLVLLGIAYSLYSQYLVPYLEEIETRKQDEVRVSDINKLDEALKATLSTTTSANLKDKTVYVSLPSESPTCEDLELPKLPIDWKYNCVTKENLTKTDGTGWLPVDLSSRINILPIDPLNKSKDSLFYQFLFESKFQDFTLISEIKSFSNLPKIPNSTKKISINSNLRLGLESANILMYLPLEYNGDDSVLIDEVKPEQKIDLPQSGLFTDKKCKLSSCLSNNSDISSTVILPGVLSTEQTESMSYSFFFKMASAPKTNFQVFNPGLGRLDTNFEGQSGSLFIWFESNEPKGYLVYKSTPKKFTDNKWHKLFVTKQGQEIKVFVDGKRIGKLTAPKSEPAKILKNASIEMYPGLSINELTVYGKGYSEQEVELFYKESFK